MIPIGMSVTPVACRHFLTRFLIYHASIARQLSTHPAHAGSRHAARGLLEDKRYVKGPRITRLGLLIAGLVWLLPGRERRHDGVAHTGCACLCHARTSKQQRHARTSKSRGRGTEPHGSVQ